MGRPGQRRPENQFQHLLDHLCRLDALGLRTGPGHRYKWARKYGIDIQVTQLNDYVESLNQYTAGKFDGCTMTNMDALTVPAASGVDSTALLAGSYSNGNDGIVLKGTGKTLEDLKGQSVHLVQFSVSHYLLARVPGGRRPARSATSGRQYLGRRHRRRLRNARVQAVVTWNPQLSAIAATPGSTGLRLQQGARQIIDLMVVNSATLKDNPALGKALTGAWFEVMA